jgi:hypothetical protein
LPAQALSYLNFGVAEAVYADVVSREQNVDFPLDNAMRAWKQGLTALKRLPRNELSQRIEARLLSNMAWGLLKMKHNDHVQDASTFAGDSLKVYDEMDHEKQGLGRALALVASCLHKSGSAVTAEGLFLSAISEDDTMNSSTLQKVQLRDSYRALVDLYRDWEKRDGDAKHYDDKASVLSASLPPAWQGKIGIHSTLCFWTPEVFDQR